MEALLYHAVEMKDNCDKCEDFVDVSEDMCTFGKGLNSSKNILYKLRKVKQTNKYTVSSLLSIQTYK